jgi:hypothetical protein
MAMQLDMVYFDIHGAPGVAGGDGTLPAAYGTKPPAGYIGEVQNGELACGRPGVFKKLMI